MPCCHRRCTDKDTDKPLDCDLALPGDSLKVLRNKNVMLRMKLKTLHWPRLTSFVADGHLYPLPWGTCQAPPTFDTTKLQYLTGFFDGDGSVVSFGAGAKRCSLQIGQSYDGADVLMMYHTAFGGGIYRMGDGKGLHKPALQWQLSESHMMSSAASLLSQHSITKKRQLHIAAHWPSVVAAREAPAAELRSLKRFDSGWTTTCTWEYFTGFFDAEGCITANGRSGLRLSVAQKYITVLQCVQHLLACEMGIAATIRKGPAAVNSMQVDVTASCQRILEKMLAVGMVRKKRQAELALDLKIDNIRDIRSSLLGLSGNQMFGKQLDKAGLDRAQDIKMAQRRAARAEKRGELNEAKRILQDVDALKLEHATKNAERENFLLHAYMQGMQNLQHEDIFCKSADMLHSAAG